MSTAELALEPEIASATVFDADEAITTPGPESTGVPMTKEEFLAVEDWDEHCRYELIHGVVIVSPPPAEGERDPNEELGHWFRTYRDSHPQGGCINHTL